MGRKANPEWRARNRERLNRQKECYFCGRRSSPRYLIIIDGDLAHRKCVAKYLEWLKEQKQVREREKEKAISLTEELQGGITWDRLKELQILYNLKE